MVGVLVDVRKGHQEEGEEVHGPHQKSVHGNPAPDGQVLRPLLLVRVGGDASLQPDVRGEERGEAAEQGVRHGFHAFLPQGAAVQRQLLRSAAVQPGALPVLGRLDAVQQVHEIVRGRDQVQDQEVRSEAVHRKKLRSAPVQL